MWRFLPILIFVFACSKSSQHASSDPVYLDSLSDQFFKYYLLDVDSNGTMDLKIGWRVIPLGTNITIYSAVALNSGTKIHATLQSQPICRDSTFYPTYTYINTHSCSGGPNQIRIDTFTATPNLMYSELQSTAVNILPEDSFLIYQRTFVWNMPLAPYYYNEEVEHGFFLNATSGYLLFRVNGKRFAALLNRSEVPFIANIVKIDP